MDPFDIFHAESSQQLCERSSHSDACDSPTSSKRRQSNEFPKRHSLGVAMAGTAEVAFGSEPVSFKTAASSIVITPPVFPSDPRFLRRPSLDSASSTTTTNSKGVSSVFPPGSPFLERLVESDDGSPSEPLLEADQAQQELLQLELNDFPNVQVHGVLAALDASNPSVDKLEMIKALPVSTSVKEVVQEIVNRIAELELPDILTVIANAYHVTPATRVCIDTTMLAQVLFMFADALFQDHAVPTTVALDFNYEHAVSVDGIPSSLHILMKSSTSQTTQWELNRAVRLVQPDSGEEEDAEMTGDSGELENLRLLGAAARLASTLGAQIRPPTEEETYLAGEDFTSGMVVLTLPNVDVPELTAANAILAAMVRHPPMQTASSQDTPNQFLLAAPLTRANMASSLFGDDNSRYQSAEVLLMATASSAGDETADGYPRLSNTSTHNKRPSMSAANSASGFFANYTDMDELDERKLLVVEDNTINQRIISAFLSSIGFHHVTYAADGADALMHYNDSVASGAPFDVIFMDEGLPTLSGTSMAQHIRQRSGDSMQVIISVSASPDFAADAEYRRVCGYDDAIVKPVTKEALRLMLEKWGPNGLGRKERLASLARLGVLLVDDMGLGL